MKLAKRIIKKLIKTEDNSDKISIYLSTQPKSTSQSINKDSTRFKNILRKLDAKVSKRNTQLTEVFGNLKRLVDDKIFWQHQTSGLAIFADSRAFQVVNLPYAVSDTAVVGRQYLISPLLAMQSMVLRYFVVDISLHNPTLYAGDEYEFRRIEDANLPASIEDELGLNHHKKSLHFRSGGSGGRVFFFGHAKVNEHHTVQIRNYYKILAGRLQAYLRKVSLNEPLILVGTNRRIDELRPLLESTTVLDNNLEINIDEISIRELHEISFNLISQEAKRDRHILADCFRRTDNEYKVDGISAVLGATKRGAIETLILPIIREYTEPVQGDLSPLLLEIPKDSHKFELAIRGVANQRGIIRALEIDEFVNDSSMKALLRYPG